MEIQLANPVLIQNFETILKEELTSNPNQIFEKEDKEDDDSKNNILSQLQQNLYDVRIYNTRIWPYALDINTMLLQLNKSGVLMELPSKELKKSLEQFIFSPINKQFLSFLYWYLLCSKYTALMENQNLLQELRIKVHKAYMLLLHEMPKPQELFLDLVIMGNVYACVTHYWKIFKKQRSQFGHRFIYDCMHIVTFSTTGLFISDYSIQMLIDQIFTSKFMHFEKENKIKQQVQRMLQQRKVPKKEFLNNPLHFPDIASCHMGNDFTQNLKENLYGQHLIGGNQSLSNLKQIQQEKEKEDAFKKRSLSDRAMSTTAQSRSQSNVTGTITNDIYDPLNKFDYKNQQYEIRELEEQRRALLLIKTLKFNCSQISPGIGRLLQNTKFQIETSKPQVIQHEIEKIEQGREKLKVMLDELESKRRVKTEAFVEQKSAEKRFIQRYQVMDKQISRDIDYREQTELTQKYLRNMIDLKYVLRKYRFDFNELPSSIRVNKMKNLEADLQIERIKKNSENFKHHLQRIMEGSEQTIIAKPLQTQTEEQQAASPLQKSQSTQKSLVKKGSETFTPLPANSGGMLNLSPVKVIKQADETSKSSNDEMWLKKSNSTQDVLKKSDQFQQTNTEVISGFDSPIQKMSFNLQFNKTGFSDHLSEFNQQSTKISPIKPIVQDQIEAENQPIKRSPKKRTNVLDSENRRHLELIIEQNNREILKGKELQQEFRGRDSYIPMEIIETYNSIAQRNDQFEEIYQKQIHDINSQNTNKYLPKTKTYIQNKDTMTAVKDFEKIHYQQTYAQILSQSHIMQKYRHQSVQKAKQRFAGIPDVY